jgi:hypothetical protein
MTENYTVYVQDKALEEAIRQGGELRQEVVGSNPIKEPIRRHTFESQQEAFRWKNETIQKLDDSGGSFHFRSPQMNADSKDADQWLYYRNG